MYKLSDFEVKIKNKEGKNRKVKSYNNFICIGSGAIDQKAVDENPIQKTSSGLVVKKEYCSKCYLCLLREDPLFLDSDNFPSFTATSSNVSFTIQDRIRFEKCLEEYNEETGISKWVALLFYFYGFNETFVEASIPKDSIPSNILSSFNGINSKNVYKKGPVADIEINGDKFIFLFENKKHSTKDDNWLKTAVKQVIYYASSSIYTPVPNQNIYFIISYNSSSYELDRFNDIISNKPYSKITTIAKKSGVKICMLHSNHFYEQMLDDITNKSINKSNLISLIRSNVII